MIRERVTVDDFEMAQNHFENDKHLGEFVIALFWYYKTRCFIFWNFY
jgi:hypothetical protein